MRTAQAHTSVYPASKLYVAFELASKKWKLAMADGPARKPRIIQVAPFDQAALLAAVGKGKERCGLPADAEVLVVMEAGRDGFSVHRWLEHLAISSIVIDAASVEVSRHRRRAKTDRLDAEKLLAKLIQYDSGDKAVWRVCHVPSERAEDDRRLSRERETVVAEATEHVNRIKSMLALHGIQMRVGTKFLGELDQVHDPRGRPLPKRAVGEIKREYERLILARRQIAELNKEMRVLATVAPSSDASEVDRKTWVLAQLRGVGPVGARTIASEIGWRDFENRRQVGSAAGLTPTPYDTGESAREQGISKVGNRRIRRIMIEGAWSWLRFQPDSDLSKWFNARYSVRGKKKGIVALARKLLIALWHWFAHGAVPDNSEFKSSSSLAA